MSWFQRAKPAAPEPAPVAGADGQARYGGKPLLYILEDYVLDVIGALDASRQQALPAVVKRVFGGGEDWKATLRTVLKVNDGMDASIRGMWERNQQIARDNGIILTPREFAEMVVTRNFAPLLTDA